MTKKETLKWTLQIIASIISAVLTALGTTSCGLFDVDTHHGEVVVGLGAGAVFLDLGGEGLDDLMGGVETGVAEDAEQAVVAKLLLLAVLGLVQAVGIDEEGMVLDVLDLLADILQIGPQADGGIGLHLEEVAMIGITAQDWGIMAGIAEGEVAGLQIEEAEEEGDEHAALVVVA